MACCGAQPLIPTFLLYNEELNYLKNFNQLRSKVPEARMVQSVGNIFQSHKHLAQISNHDKFIVVDGDSFILDEFDFNNAWRLPVTSKSVSIFRARNPINGLVYGNGGIKLFSTDCFDVDDISMPDMTMSVGLKYNRIDILASDHNFNTSPFNSWRTAFRECAKLQNFINRSNVPHGLLSHNQIVNTWCTVGEDKDYGKFAIEGAKQGVKFANTTDNMFLVNDFLYIKELYNQLQD